MDSKLLATLLLASIAVIGLHQSQSNLNNSLELEDLNQFHSFVTEYSKEYESEQEFSYRLGIFKQTLRFIESHNEDYKNGKETHTVGVNQDADLTDSEFKGMKCGYKAPTFKHDQVFVPKSTEVAETVDWVTKGAVTPIKDQGDCGSCWSFSATGGLEGFNFINSGTLVSYSEQQIVDCTYVMPPWEQYGCAGGNMDVAYQYTHTKGIEPEATYPYTGQLQICTYNQSATKVVNSNYAKVTAQSDSALVTAINQQPVSIGIEADRPAFRNYKTGIITSSECGTILDHGVLAVGYGSDYFLVKNSWNANWGDKGYVKIGRNGDGLGICGILTDPSVPN